MRFDGIIDIPSKYLKAGPESRKGVHSGIRNVTRMDINTPILNKGSNTMREERILSRTHSPSADLAYLMIAAYESFHTSKNS